MSDDNSTNPLKKVTGALTPDTGSNSEEEEESVDKQTVEEIKSSIDDKGYTPDDIFTDTVAEEMFSEEEEIEDEEEEDEGPDMEEIVEEEFYEEYLGFDWKSKVPEFRNNIDTADEDPSARRKLELMPTRLKEYFTFVSDTRETVADLILPLTVIAYGLLFVIISFVLSGDARQLLVEPNRFGDLFLVNTIIVGIAIILFLVSRKYSDPQEHTRLDSFRRNARRGLIGLLVIPTAILGWFIYALVTRGADSVFETSGAFRDLRIYLNQEVLPEQISSIGFWIWEITPLGVSVQEVAAISTLVGLVLLIPLQLDLAKIVVISGTVGEREQLQEDDEEDEEREDIVEFDNSKTLVEENKGGGIPPLVKEVMEKIEYDSLKDLSREIKEDEDHSEWANHFDEYLQVHQDMKTNPYEKEYEEIERYWLKEPYSYAKIFYSEEESNYRYYAVEPQLSIEEKELYRKIEDKLSTQLRSAEVESEYETDMQIQQKLEILEQSVFNIATKYNIPISDKGLQKILYYVERNYVGYNEIDVLMNDINAEDISCLGPDQPIWINHSEYENIITNVQFERRDLVQFIRELAQRSGESINSADPLLDATLPDGSRAQLSLGDEITTQGSTFTIRQFQDIPFTPVDLVRTKTFSLDQMAYLWLAIQNGMSLIFAGGTASGKTTSMNAMSLFIPPDKKVVTLEDTREITLPHSNWIPGKTREGAGGGDDEEGGDAVTMYNLLESALRQRPEYIVVGEVRGEEAQTLFQAMSTGHTTYSTMHADTVREAIYRLKNDPINVPEKMVNVLDIICIQRRLIMGHKAVRRNINVTEIYEGGSEAAHKKRKVFTRDASRDDWNDKTQNSKVLEEIKEENMWNDEYLRDEIERRKNVMKYLIDDEIVEFKNVVQVLQRYMLIEGDEGKERFLQSLRNGEVTPEELDDITDLDLGHVDNPDPEDRTDQLLKENAITSPDRPQLEE